MGGIVYPNDLLLHLGSLLYTHDHGGQVEAVLAQYHYYHPRTIVHIHIHRVVAVVDRKIER